MSKYIYIDKFLAKKKIVNFVNNTSTNCIFIHKSIDNMKVS